MPAASASAATPSPGRVAVEPAGGNDQSALTLVTSGPCRHGTNVVASVFGHGFGRFGQDVIGNSPIKMFATTNSGGMIIPLAGTLRYFANIPQVPVVLSGPYTFVVYCRTATGLANLQTFSSASVTVAASGPAARTYHVSNPAGVPTAQAASAVDPDPYGSSPTTPSAAVNGGASNPSTVASHAAQANPGSGATSRSGPTAARTAASSGGAPSSGGSPATTIVASILGALVLAAVAGFVLVRRRRASAGSTLRRANLGSTT